MNFSKGSSMKILFVIIFICYSLLNHYDTFCQNYLLTMIDIEKNEKNVNRSFNDYFEAFEYSQKYINKKHENGYIEACYDRLTIFENKVNLYTNLGKQYITSKIVYKDIEAQIFNEINVKLKKYIEKPVNFQEIELINLKLINYYENNGYPFISIKYDSIQIVENSMAFYMNIDKGSMYLIDSIHYKGNSKINTKFLNNYLDISENDFYNELKIKSISQKISELEFIETTVAPAIEFHKQDAELFIFINEKKANIFNGIVGFLPNSENSKKIQLSGDINLKIMNSLHQGETFDFIWKKYKPLSQNLDIYFDMPYIAGTNFGIEENVSIEKVDTTYLKLINYTGIQYYFSGKNFVSTYISNNNSFLLGKNELLTNEYKNYKSNLLGLKFSFQQLDYQFNPRKGYLFLFKSGFGIKTINDSLKTNQSENELIFQYFLTIYKNFILKIENKSSLLYNNKEILENELYKIGGINNLRGFDEKAVLTSGFSIFSIELRYIYEKNSNVYLFSDFGYLLKNTDAEYIENYPISFGTGLNFSTDAGIFTLSYGIGKLSGNPYILKNAKIHFGFVSIF